LDYESLHKRGVTARALLEGYSVLHEADLSKTVDVAKEWLRESAVKVNPLKRQRMLAGLTQKELASLAGVPLRVIRSYEQGQRSLENAGAESTLRLSRALSCQIEDLL
jgi:DNA-binding XRE family transcriptional regulator